MSSYIKSVFKRWSWSQNQSGRITYAPSEVCAEGQPPVSLANPTQLEGTLDHTHDRNFVPVDSTQSALHTLDDAQTRAEQEELMMALSISQSLHDGQHHEQLEVKFAYSCQLLLSRAQCFLLLCIACTTCSKSWSCRWKMEKKTLDLVCSQCRLLSFHHL